MKPTHLGADESPLSQILDDAAHAPQLSLPDEDRRRLYLWLDANALSTALTARKSCLPSAAEERSLRRKCNEV